MAVAVIYLQMTIPIIPPSLLNYEQAGQSHRSFATGQRRLSYREVEILAANLGIAQR
jgi:hypothetical protein